MATVLSFTRYTLALRAVGKANVQNPLDFVLVQKKVGKEKHTPTSPLFFAYLVFS
ncbi:hypothetical protein [Lonepinella sp. BR2930]|uniref:hypothetical protein n=1 Tax=Lonepinella sp. BR2930 TaxID=3434554 RepID=UPI003F6DBB77